MTLKIKKGLDLDLAGGLEPGAKPIQVSVSECAVIPDDFHGFVPKLDVKEGDKVLQGQSLLHDKNHEAVKLVAPAAGTVKEVVRGERRKIERVVIAIEGSEAEQYDTAVGTDKAKAIDLLSRSGMLARMRQRPYDIVPDPEVTPRDVFVTAMDTAPLSPGLITLSSLDAKAMTAAVKLLSYLTTGSVYICTGDDWRRGDIPGAKMVEVFGKHPAGTVGAQIANIKPINKGETVWTLDIITLNKIGKLLITGTVDTSTLLAVTGSEARRAHIVSTIEGAQVAPIIKGELAHPDEHVRIISGNVLTGTSIGPDGFLRFPYRQLTLIPEGDTANEFMGWASLSPKKMSTSRSFLGHFFGRKFSPDARILGGRRAMIMSEEYDKVFPMDIMPEFLLKAILAKDIEQMEKLGIYEVAPEDFALAEYVDTSKQPLQRIVRDGLDYLRKELS